MPEDAPLEIDDRDLDELDDEQDREELRARYYGLLQELRVILPGVQVLLAFLLTAPFANRFAELDHRGRALFAVALLSALASVILLLTPTVMHRLGDRRARTNRLRWGIRLTIVGLSTLAVSLLSALWCITRLVFGATQGIAAVAIAGALIVGLWVALPRLVGRHDL